MSSSLTVEPTKDWMLKSLPGIKKERLELVMGRVDKSRVRVRVAYVIILDCRANKRLDVETVVRKECLELGMDSGTWKSGFGFQKIHSGPENFKKSKPKNLVKF